MLLSFTAGTAAAAFGFSGSLSSLSFKNFDNLSSKESAGAGLKLRRSVFTAGRCGLGCGAGGGVSCLMDSPIFPRASIDKTLTFTLSFSFRKSCTSFTYTLETSDI